MATWPKGFYVADSKSKSVLVPMGLSKTIACGDMLTHSSGLVECAAAGSTVFAGVSLQAQVSASSGVELIAAGAVDDPYTLLVGTADGSMATPVYGDEIDLVGTTGIHQLDADASATDMFTLISKYVDRDQTITAAGLACYVHITAAKHLAV